MNGVRHVGGQLPTAHQIIADVDRRAKAGADQAASDALAVVRSEGPGSFSGKSMTSRVAKSRTGYIVVVEPIKAMRRGLTGTGRGGGGYIAGYVTRGTGIYGPKKKPIRPRKAKAFKFNGREYKTLKGQKPNPFIARARDRATAAAERAITAAGVRR